MPDQGNSAPESITPNVEQKEQSINSSEGLGNIEVPKPVIETAPAPTAVEQPAQTIPQSPMVPNTTIAPATPVDIGVSPVEDSVDDNINSAVDGIWIKKAEEIIENDKDAPYKEEIDHEKLQVEYLKKRFGKDIKMSNQEE